MPRTPHTQARILSILDSEHLRTATQLVDDLATVGESVNKTTVYRAIEKLLEQGELCKHLFDNDLIYYERRGHHHDHFVCEKCGLVKTIECKDTHKVTVPNVTISHVHMTVYGLCEGCR